MRCNTFCLQIAIFAALITTACSKDETDKKAFYDQTVERLREKGLEVSDLASAAAKPYDAKQCARGQVAQLDLLICAYADADAAQRAENKVQRFVDGAVSGAVRRAASQVLAIADRDKKDLQGKVIQGVLTAFSPRGQ